MTGPAPFPPTVGPTSFTLPLCGGGTSTSISPCDRLLRLDIGTAWRSSLSVRRVCSPSRTRPQLRGEGTRWLSCLEITSHCSRLSGSRLPRRGAALTPQPCKRLAGARFHPKMQPPSSTTRRTILLPRCNGLPIRERPSRYSLRKLFGPRPDTYPRSTALLKDIQEIEQKAQAALTTRKPRLNGAF